MQIHIDSKNYFNPHAFTLSDSFLAKKESTIFGDIIVIENFYENINMVYEEMNKLPMTLIWDESKRKIIKNKIIDCRKSYASNMVGTSLPYTEQLPSKINKFLNLKEKQIYVPGELLINCSKKLKKYPQNTYYNIHKDPLMMYDAAYSYAVIIFLNLDYADETTGLNIYKNTKKTYPDQFFFSNDESELVHFVQAKPNRAVLIPGQVEHGPEIGINSQFYEDWRYTQVIFLPIFENCNEPNINLSYE